MARLPIIIPAIVPAAPIRLPRIAASTVPVVAATMAGRCERKRFRLGLWLGFWLSSVAGHDLQAGHGASAGRTV